MIMTVELPVKISLQGMPEVKAGLTDLQRSWNLQAQAIRGMVGALGATAVIAKTISFLKETHAIAQQSRTAITLLTTQLGYYSSALNEQADALSKTLFIQKTEILQADQRLLLYTREESSIKKLIPGIIDLAKVKGIDLATAANTVGLALRRADESAIGHSVTIRGLGIAFKNTGTEAGNVAALEDALKKAVGGAGQAVADSLDGWSKFSFWLGRVKEQIGKGIFGGTKAEEDAAAYADALEKVKEKVEWVPGTQFSAGYYRELTKTQLNAAMSYITEYEKKQKDDKAKAAQKEADEKAADAVELNDKIQEKILQSSLEGKKVLLAKERDAEIKSGADKVLAYKLYAIKVEEIDKEIAQKKEDAQKKEYVKIAEGQEPWYADPKYNEEMAKQAKEREELLQTSEENIADLEDAATDDQYARRAKQIQKEHNKEQAELKKFLKLKLITQKQYDDATALNDKITDKEMSDNKKKFRTEVLTGSLDMMSQLTAGSKKAAGLHKTIAIGEALVSAGSAEMGVLENSGKFIKWLGPIAGPITMGVEMALIAGLAAEQIANIASAKMAYGGVATGGTPGQDSVPAMLMPGEIVYNPAHPNPALASMITNNSSTSSHTYQISMPITIHGNPTSTTIAKVGEVTEKALLSAMRRAQNMGKLSASGLTIRH
jgi:hypothetical protein